MATEANQPANKNAEGSRLMMVEVEGALRAEQTLATVDEASEGSESASKTGEPAEAMAELGDNDFNDKEGTSDDLEEEDSAASVEKNEADSDTANPVIYFYENDETDGVRIGCSFENFCVRLVGREHYALVGPTPLTGGAVVCAMAALLPGDPDQYGVDDVYVLTRTCVCEMSRGRDMHFAYAIMHSDEHTDEAGVTETYT